MHMWYYFNATLWKLLIALVCSFACQLLIIRQCHVELNGYPSDFQYVYVTSQCSPYGVAPSIGIMSGFVLAFFSC